MNCRPSFCPLALAVLLGAPVVDTAAAIAQSIRSADRPTAQKEIFSAGILSSAAKPQAGESNLLSAAVTGQDRLPSFAAVTAGATKIDGMIPLYRQRRQLLAALSAEDFDSDLILLISIARGIGVRPLVGGQTWDFGDDWVCQFRRAGDHVHFVRRNVRHRADPHSSAAKAVNLAYTDSVLCSSPIVARGANDIVLIDLSPLLLSDLPGISQELEGFEFAAPRSTWANVRGYEQNLEIEVAAAYTSDGRVAIESVPDSRSITVHVHYSLSRLPKSNFRPRLADDRIGYFLTVAKDYSQPIDQDRFVRYVNRWDLRKVNPVREVSPAVEPIIFWLENTIPDQYRAPIREGILEWNKAFERIGFQRAIEVRQQPDDPRWEPGDIRYNTFRWTTSGTAVASGPSRVNPLTGQILDADITFDADFLQVWKRKYETITPAEVARLTGGPLDLRTYRLEQETRRSRGRQLQCACGHVACGLMHGISHEMALSATVLARRRLSKSEIDVLAAQVVRKVAMHEVGHALGLRHNFMGSTLYSVEEIQRRSLGEGDVVTSGSVMDYIPPHLAPPGEPQGRYYPSTIGPYDYWAIEYGYRPFDADSTEAERPYLSRIASRSGERGLAFATDEEARGIDADPHSVRFDYGDDLLEFAESQADIVADSWGDLTERLTPQGEGYQQARQAFGVLMITQGRAMFAAARYIGGIYGSRDHRGDAGDRSPHQPVSAERQRRALELLAHRMFSDDAFDFPPQLFGQLASSHWRHWGSDAPQRREFPIHESVLLWQDRILEKLMSSLTLTRLHDSELQIPADEDAFTVAELLERLTGEIFAEVSSLESGGRYTNRQPAISSLRRALQRAYLDRLSTLALGQPETPSDCQAIACLEMTRLDRRVEQLLSSQVRLDNYSLAHLTQVAVRIGKVLDAQYVTAR